MISELSELARKQRCSQMLLKEKYLRLLPSSKWRALFANFRAALHCERRPSSRLLLELGAGRLGQATHSHKGKHVKPTNTSIYYTYYFSPCCERGSE